MLFINCKEGQNKCYVNDICFYWKKKYIIVKSLTYSKTVTNGIKTDRNK